MSASDARPEVRDYPQPADVRSQVEPSPRRVRGVLNGRTVFDTRAARYVWDSVKYPQYYIPVGAIAPGVLVDEDREQRLRRGTARVHGLAVGDVRRPSSARLYGPGADGVANLVRFDWDALDAWYEEDEEIFVHPRNPYTRVDALRSSAIVRVELDGTRIAESSCPVLVFETGLPTRYYLDRTDVDWSLLRRTDEQTACPYKGRTSDYWNVVVGDRVAENVAWSYAFTTPALSAIAGLVAFYNDRVDITVDGRVAEATPDLSQQPAV